MENELRHHLVTCAAAFVVASGLSLATVGRQAANDWRFFVRLESGAGFTAGKYDEVMRWFAANWPKGAAWPDGIPSIEAEAAA